MQRPMRSLALANLILVILILIWPEGLTTLFMIYLIINSVAIVIIADLLARNQEEIRRLKKKLSQ